MIIKYNNVSWFQGLLSTASGHFDPPNWGWSVSSWKGPSWDLLGSRSDASADYHPAWNHHGPLVLPIIVGHCSPALTIVNINAKHHKQKSLTANHCCRLSTIEHDRHSHYNPQQRSLIIINHYCWLLSQTSRAKALLLTIVGINRWYCYELTINDYCCRLPLVAY